MRGTRLPGNLGSCQHRFIPAHAGNTRSSESGPRNKPVHPRACGEHCLGRFRNYCGCGSSPRMRGTRDGEKKNDPGNRFIPAHAGNTQSIRPPLILMAVHPRACGEHSRRARIVIVSPGSSPRMRGTLLCRLWSLVKVRFIPAHAGNTSTPGFPFISTTVHPRACGEHNGQGNQRFVQAGSSPRMRGTRRRLVRCRQLWRFIPAHAGNTPEDV